MEVLGLVWGFLKLVFYAFIFIIGLIIQFVQWIVRTTREARARRLREELEEANIRRESAEANSSEFISGEPDLIEGQMNENQMNENGQPSDQDIMSTENSKVVIPDQKETATTLKHSRWDLIKPDKKESEKDNPKKESTDRWTLLKKINEKEKKDQK
jgi:hypothetical protein